MTKTILILANSIRRNHRCIAGREASNEGHQWRVGAWVRPVSSTGEGEVMASQSQCEDGSQPAVLDVITIPLTGPAPCDHQPENYHIDPATRWVKVGRVAQDLSAILEGPTSLWLQPATRTDRIHSSVLNRGQDFQSLYLIRPVGLRFRIWEEMNPFRGHQHRQRRALFEYSGVQYDLPVTDPTMDQRHFTPFPVLNQPPRDVLPTSPERCLLVVSLAAPFTDGYHYKVVATVLEY